MNRELVDSGIDAIGKIPNNWECRRLKHFFNFSTGGTPPSKNGLYYNDNGYYWVNISDMGNSYFLDDTKHKITLIGVNIANMKLNKKGSLLYSFKLSIGNVGFLSKPMYTNEAIAVFVPNNKYDLRYFYYSFPNQIVYNANINIYGAKLLNRELIKNAYITYPTYSDQQAIADFLDQKTEKIEELIKVQETAIKRLEEYKQSVITTAITKGLDPNVNMKYSGIKWIGLIPNNWGTSKLKYLTNGSLQYGANESGIEYSDDLPRYIRITDILDNNLLSMKNKLSLNEFIAQPFLLKDGDVLFARSGATVGKTFIYNSEFGKCAFAGYLIRAKINTLMFPKYLYYFTLSSSYLKWKDQIFIQATIQNIGATKYANMVITLPPYNLQNNIINYLDKKTEEINQLIQIKKDKIEKLKEYKKSLIYEAVTGKIEVM